MLVSGHLVTKVVYDTGSDGSPGGIRLEEVGQKAVERVVPVVVVGNGIDGLLTSFKPMPQSDVRVGTP